MSKRVPVMDRALALLARRAHGRDELRRKLTAKGYDGDRVDEVIERLVELGYIDDEATARRAAEGVLARRKGLLAVRRHLLRHGFDDELARRICSDPDLLRAERLACVQAVERLEGGRSGRMFGGCDSGDGCASRTGSRSALEMSRLWKRLRGRGFLDDTIAKVLREDGC